MTMTMTNLGKRFLIGRRAWRWRASEGWRWLSGECAGRRSYGDGGVSLSMVWATPSSSSSSLSSSTSSSSFFRQCDDLLSSNVLIAKHGRNGELDEARRAFDTMPRRDAVTWNTMVSAYVCNGRLDLARAVFDQMPERNVVSWNAMITGYARAGLPEDALSLFCCMESEKEEAEPNKITFVSVLGACLGPPALQDGKSIHSRAALSGLDSDTFVGTALIRMYDRCGSLEDACLVFERIPVRDRVCRTAMIGAYAHHRDGERALDVFDEMGIDGVGCDRVTFVTILDACGSLGKLCEGKRIHAALVAYGGDKVNDISVGNALVTMYGGCSSPANARRVFEQMQVHDEISWNAIVLAYARNGFVENAMEMLSCLPCPNLYSLTTMIAAHAHNGHGGAAVALVLLERMLQDGPKPDWLAFISVLEACGGLAALEKGKMVHAGIIAHCRLDDDNNVVVASALIHMYGRCGSVADAIQVFEKTPQRNVVSWNAMITAHASNGDGREALNLFQRMIAEGRRPDKVTFITLLSACSRAGFVDDALYCFVAMCRDHKVLPKVGHYACMVDVLTRVGRLDEAEGFINGMPFEPPFQHHIVAWKCFLGASKVHGDVERGAYAAEHLFEFDPKNATILSLQAVG